MTQLIIVTAVIVVCGGIWLWIRTWSGKTETLRYEQLKARKAQSSDRLQSEKNISANQTHSKQLRKQNNVKKLPIFSLLLIIFVVAAVIISAIIVFENIRREEEVEPVSGFPANAIQAMHKTAGRILGQYLNDHYQDDKVLVLLPPEKLMTAADQITLEKLKATAKASLTLKEHSIQPGNTHKKPLAGIWLTPELFDKSINSNPGYSVILSIAGLPIRAEESQFWNQIDKYDLILMNAPAYRLGKMISKGAVDAILVRRPVLTESIAELPPAHEKKWLLITSDNLEQVRKRYKGLFTRSETEAEEATSRK